MNSLKNCILIALIYSFLPSLTFAQPKTAGRPQLNFVINGMVKDSASRKALSFATVSLVHVKSDKVVDGALCKENGTYQMNIKVPGKYYLYVDFIGYKSMKTKAFILKPPKMEYTIPDVYLVGTGVIIKDFLVKAKNRIYEVKADKKIFKASKDLSAKSGSVLELLQNVPDVNVDIDGVISLRGSSQINMLIDGKPLQMSASGINALLSQMPATNVDNIEIITNPSAKYDPEGMAGIINIVLKKKKSLGFNGNFSVGVTSNPSLNTSLTLNYNQKNLNLYGTVGMRGKKSFFYGIGNSNSEYITTRELKDGDTRRGGYFYKIGADYSLSKKDFLSINFSANDNSHTDDQILNIFENRKTISEVYRTVRTVERINNHSGNSLTVGYDHKFKKKDHQFSILGNFSTSTRQSDESYFSDLFVDSAGYYDGFLAQETTLPRSNMNSFLKVDYVQALNKKSKIEIGAKSIFRAVDDAIYSKSGDTSNHTLIGDTNINNQFVFDEQVHALYGIYHQDLGKKWKAQAGLRLEYVDNVGTLVETGEENTQTYFSYYPSLFLTYNFDKASSFTSSYSRRVNRPNLRNLNPFASYTSPISRRIGNPKLKPEYINSYQLGYAKYQRKWNFNADVYFRQKVNSISRTVSLDSSGVSTVQSNNIDNTESFGSSVNFGFRPDNKTMINLSSNINFSIFSLDVEGSGYANSGLSFRTSLFLSRKLPRDYAVQLVGFYKSPFAVAQGQIFSFNSLNFAMSKKILKKRGQLTLGVNDIFNSLKFKVEVDGNGFTQSYYRKSQTRAVTLNFIYNFGTQSNKKRQRIKGGNGGDSEDMGM